MFVIRCVCSSPRSPPFAWLQGLRFWACLAVLALQLGGIALAEDQCYGPIVKLSIGGHDELTAYGALAGFGGELLAPLQSIPMIAANPLEACQELPVGLLSGRLVVGSWLWSSGRPPAGRTRNPGWMCLRT